MSLAFHLDLMNTCLNLLRFFAIENVLEKYIIFVPIAIYQGFVSNFDNIKKLDVLIVKEEEMIQLIDFSLYI